MVAKEEIKREHWGLDKRIPIAMIFALFLQFVGTITYVVNLDNRVAGLEKAIAQSTMRDTDNSKEGRQVLERLVRVEEKLGALLDYVRRIDTPPQRRTEHIP